VAGQIGSGALSFDGTDGLVEIPYDPKLDLDSTLTITGWVNLADLSTYYFIVAKAPSGTAGDNYPGNYEFRITVTTGALQLLHQTSEGQDLSTYDSTSTVPVGQWTHVAVTLEQGGLVQFYIDGVAAGSGDQTGTFPILNDEPVRIGGRKDGYSYFNGQLDDIRIYDEVLPAEEIPGTMIRVYRELATVPSPEDEATDVLREMVLGWMSGKYAQAHDVYLGTVFDDVNDADRANPLGVLVSQGQAMATYDPPGVLHFGQTYYWRIDEVNAAPDSTIFKGEVWSFTAESLAYPIEGIIATCNVASEEGLGLERTVDGSGLAADGTHSTTSSDMWLVRAAAGETIQLQYEFDRVYKLHEMQVWNYNVAFELILGFGLKDVTVEYSVDGVEWVLLGEVECAQATACTDYTPNTAIDFMGVAARYVRLTVNGGYGTMGQFGLSEVQFLQIPASAREPQPADAAAEVSVETVLGWRAGREAVSHEVSFGADPETLALVDTTAETSYTPAALDLETTYYWRVDEVNDADEIAVWAGGVWSFTTQAFLVVDDFESYDDEDNVIYESWIDGWFNETGSTVGYLSAPFAETTIVNSGSQSMPLSYDNAGVATAEAELDLAQDWTASGIQSLSLSFHGDADSSGGQLYVKINGTMVAYDGPAVDLTRETWQVWNIDLAASGASLDDVSSLVVGVEGAGASGIVYIDDIRLYPEVVVDISSDVTGAGDAVKGVPDDGDWPGAETPDLAIDDDTATKFLHFKGETEPTGIQITPLAGSTIVAGITFTTANDAAERDPATFELYGSNDSIDGPYTLIASGDIVDFTGETAWPRFTKNETAIAFANSVAYAHYQVLFPTVRDPGSANSMQIAEVELLGEVAP
jgi:Concanavalin A-like lectin/glucanases superfamily